MPQAPIDSEFGPSLNPLEAILLKNGKSELNAMPEDFKRVFVEAENPWAAQGDENVVKVANEEGYRVIGASPVGTLTDNEILAHQRKAMGEQEPLDRSKL